MAALISVSSLSMGGAARPRLDGVSFDLAPGEMVGIIGPNGAGKSSLLTALAGVASAWTGTVTLSGRDVHDWDRLELARLVSYLPQDFHSQWALTVENLIELGASRGAGFGWAKPSSARGTDWVYEAFELTQLRHRPFHGLSGGEQARAVLAASLVARPSILLADEPIANLDPYHQLDTLRHLRAFAHDGMTILISLHDLTLAARFCDRLILLDQGRIEGMGKPNEVLSTERLAAIYRIEALIGRKEGQTYLVPWRRLS